VTRDFLSHPHAAGNRFVEKRSVPRYHLIAEIEIFEPIQRTKLMAYTAELGANGCYIRVQTPLQLSTVIQVRILKDRVAFKTWGRVVHTQDGVGMGIAFFRPEPNQDKTLQRWIADLEGRHQETLEPSVRTI
jgi:PilZ domain